MSPKKTTILCVRLEDDFKKHLNSISSYHCISVGSIVRKLIKSYLISKGFKV